MSDSADLEGIEGGFDLSSLTFASEPLTTKDFFALDVDEKLKVELIGGALIVSPSPKPWHGDVVVSIFEALKPALGTAYRMRLDLDLTIDEENVVRPDIFVLDAAAFDPDRVANAADVVLAVEVVSPGSKVYDRRVKPELYRNAGIPSWRIERSEQRLFLVETPVRGEERTHLGPTKLKVVDIDVAIDLDAIARYAFGT